MRRVFSSSLRSACGTIVAVSPALLLLQHTTTVRDMSSAAFAKIISQTHESFVQSKSKEAQANGKRMFESEVLDDIDTSMTPENAMMIANAATALRIRPAVGTVFPKTIQWAMSDDVVAKMPAEPISRLLHACVILHSPLFFDLLITYLWYVVKLAPKMDPVVCAVLINAYGRAGVQHPRLYEALGARAEQTITDDTITMPHVANVIHSLSRVGYKNLVLLKKAQEQCMIMKGKATPLIVASVLDSFASFGVIDEALFSAYENIINANLEQCTAALVASLIGTLVNAKRTNTPLFNACCTKAIKIASTFDSASIARVMESLNRAKINNEELLGSLAERACRIPQEFRVTEARQTLETLSNFVLYDPELFPLLGSRVASILRSRGVYDVENVAAILASFAAVHERHEDLIHVGSRVLADSASSMTPKTYINALFAFSVHNVRNDNQRRLVEASKIQLPLLETEAVKDKTMKDRLDVAKKTYFK